MLVDIRQDDVTFVDSLTLGSFMGPSHYNAMVKSQGFRNRCLGGNSLFYFDHVSTSLCLNFLNYKIVIIIGLSSQVVIGGP